MTVIIDTFGCGCWNEVGIHLLGKSTLGNHDSARKARKRVICWFEEFLSCFNHSSQGSPTSAIATARKKEERLVGITIWLTARSKLTCSMQIMTCLLQTRTPVENSGPFVERTRLSSTSRALRWCRMQRLERQLTRTSDKRVRGRPTNPRPQRRRPH